MPEVLLFTRKDSSTKQAGFRDMFKKASKSVCMYCTSTVMVSLYPLSPAPLESSAMKTPENIEYDPDDPEPANERDIRVE